MGEFYVRDAHGPNDVPEWKVIIEHHRPDFGTHTTYWREFASISVMFDHGPHEETISRITVEPFRRSDQQRKAGLNTGGSE